MTLVLGVFFVLFLAYANGANDNFKGVATLLGSATTGYRKALGWATLTTMAGSIAALFLAQGLIKAFSGKGIVPDAVVALETFALAVGLGAALTVMLATWLGFPISTTHSLVGALVGAGLMASTSGINTGRLFSSFLGPLLVSPLLAIAGTGALYPLLRWGRRRLGVEKETCVCVGSEIVAAFPGHTGKQEALAMINAASVPSLSVGLKPKCIERYQGKVLGLSAATTLDALPFLSGGVVSFARGLNDTPKIAAILLATAAFPTHVALAIVAVAMAVGGLLNARKVAQTMAHRVTAMNAGQGFVANLVTGAVVILASKFSLPASTTHVSCGSLFGLGAVTRQAHWKIILSILAAWITTLPVAGILAALTFLLLER